MHDPLDHRLRTAPIPQKVPLNVSQLITRHQQRQRTPLPPASSTAASTQQPSTSGTHPAYNRSTINVALMTEICDTETGLQGTSLLDGSTKRTFPREPTSKPLSVRASKVFVPPHVPRMHQTPTGRTMQAAPSCPATCKPLTVERERKGDKHSPNLDRNRSDLKRQINGKAAYVAEVLGCVCDHRKTLFSSRRFFSANKRGSSNLGLQLSGRNSNSRVPVR